MSERARTSTSSDRPARLLQRLEPLLRLVVRVRARRSRTAGHYGPVPPAPSHPALLFELRLAPARKARVHVGNGVPVGPHASLHWSGLDAGAGRLTDADVYVLRAWCGSREEFEELTDTVILSLSGEGVHCAPLGLPLLKGEVGNAPGVAQRQIVDASRRITTSFGVPWEAGPHVARVHRLSPEQRTAAHYAHLAGMGLDTSVSAFLICAGFEALAGRPPLLLGLSKPEKRQLRTALTYGLPGDPPAHVDRCADRVATSQAYNSFEHVVRVLDLEADRGFLKKLFELRHPAAHGLVPVRMHAPHHVGRPDDVIPAAIRLLHRSIYAGS